MATFEDLARYAARLPGRLQDGTVNAMRELTRTGLAIARDNASGRPGPERVTGEYVNSMATRVSVSGGTVTGEIYTSLARGPRLEYGFIGTDSLGRRYSQPPYPHWRPTAEALEKEAVTVLGDAVGRAVG